MKVRKQFVNGEEPTIDRIKEDVLLHKDEIAKHGGTLQGLYYYREDITRDHAYFLKGIFYDVKVHIEIEG